MSPTIILDHNQVHLWYFSIHELTGGEFNGRLFESFNEKMSAREIRSWESWSSLLIRRSLLRRLLSLYTGIEPEHLYFQYNLYGKPELFHNSDRNQLFFNHSVSSDLIVYAFSLERRIGIDIEKIREVEGMELFVNKFYPMGTRELFYSLPKERRTDGFVRLWTRIEAFLKACGLGLSGMESEIWLSTPVHLSQFVIERIEWNIHEIDVNPEYSVSLVIEGKDVGIKLLGLSNFKEAHELTLA